MGRFQFGARGRRRATTCSNLTSSATLHSRWEKEGWLRLFLMAHRGRLVAVLQRTAMPSTIPGPCASFLNSTRPQQTTYPIMEFHDDVLVLEPSREPQIADFFQVKTKRGGQWTKSDLVAFQKKKAKPVAKGEADSPLGAPENGAGQLSLLERAGDHSPQSRPRSIIAKLLEHFRRFGKYVRSASLVSNAPFDVALSCSPESKDREQFCLADLSEDDLIFVTEALHAELKYGDALPFAQIYLLTVDISLTDHETHGVGRFAMFLEKTHPAKTFRSGALFKTLLGELARRATTEWQPSTYQDLLKKKGISRVEFEAWIQGAVSSSPEENLIEIVTRLNTEEIGIKELGLLKKSWKDYVVLRTDHTNTVAQDFFRDVKDAVRSVWTSADVHGLRDFVSQAEKFFLGNFGTPREPLSINLLRGGILFEYQTIAGGELSSADTQPAAPQK